MHTIQFCFGLVHFKCKIINLEFFFGNIVTSLADIFQWKKPYLKLFSGIKFLFVNRFSKFLWHVLRLMECKMVTWSYFSLGLSEK